MTYFSTGLGKAAVSAACIAMCLAISGCETLYTVGHDVNFDKSGSSMAQMRQDLGLCGASFNAFGDPYIREASIAAVDNCMANRGYRVSYTN